MRISTEAVPIPAPAAVIAFSIAITVWRREHLLPYALQSVLRQDHPCTEVFVLSDGTSREARRIIEPLSDRLTIRYRELKRRRNCWGNHLRRRALEEACGSHVVILGHDCVLYPGYLGAHAANIGTNPDALSVVPIDYWRETLPEGRHPRGDDPSYAGEGEIDLLCIAYPRRLALQLDCFGEVMVRYRSADYLSFDRLRACTALIYTAGPTQAAHY